VLESLEEVRQTAKTSDGIEITASKLCERFGFRGPRSRTLVKDLSGGERRRLQLMRLLMEEPNVLILDEPTNDLDIDTLTALEDLLDSWPGTLIVVSHDRYFVERVTDNVYALGADGEIVHLPRGIDQYIEQRRAAIESGESSVGSFGPAANGSTEGAGDGRKKPPAGGDARATRKEVARIERAIGKLDGRETELHGAMAAAATDHGRLRELNAELQSLVGEREELETAWFETSSSLEG